MNKETKEFVINQITFTLKIFSIIFGFTLLTSVFCYFAGMDGINSVKAIFSAALLACFFGIYATIKRMGSL